MVISNDRRARSQAILVIDRRYSSAIWNGSRWGPRRNLKVNVFTGCHQSPEVPSALKKKWESRAFWGICAFIRSKAIVSWAVTSVHLIFTVLVFLSIAYKRKKANSWGHGLPWVRMAMQHRSLGKKKKQNKSHNSSAKQTVITLMWLLNYLTARGLMLLTQQEAELHTLIKWLEYSYIPGYLVTMTFFFFLLEVHLTDARDLFEQPEKKLQGFNENSGLTRDRRNARSELNSHIQAVTLSAQQ